MNVDVSRYDSREDRAKRVALAAIDLATCLARDDTDTALIESFRSRWVDAGAHWVAPTRAPIDPDEWCCAAEIATLVDVSTSAVYKWHRRGHITARRDTAGRPLFNVGEVLAWLASQRKRRATTTR